MDDKTQGTAENDERFPSGEWKGFWLQRPYLKGRQRMELVFSFRAGLIEGETPLLRGCKASLRRERSGRDDRAEHGALLRVVEITIEGDQCRVMVKECPPIGEISEIRFNSESLMKVGPDYWHFPEYSVHYVFFADSIEEFKRNGKRLRRQWDKERGAPFSERGWWVACQVETAREYWDRAKTYCKSFF